MRFLTAGLMEGIIDHHLLQLHHVRDMPVHMPMYDWMFLLIGGVGFLAFGYALIAGRHQAVAA